MQNPPHLYRYLDTLFIFHVPATKPQEETRIFTCLSIYIIFAVRHFSFKITFVLRIKILKDQDQSCVNGGRHPLNST